MPSISDQPVKSLGKLSDASLNDSTAIQKSTKELDSWLTKVDKLGLPVDSRPGFTSTPSHRVSCGLSLFTQYQCQLWSPSGGKLLAFCANGWASPTASAVQRFMEPVTPCSYHLVASQKNLRWHALEKSFSIGTPGTRNCQQRVLRWEQRGSGEQREKWRWQSHTSGRRSWWGRWPPGQLAWVFSQRPKWGRPEGRRDTS